MSERQEIIDIAKNELVGIVAQYMAEGYRLVQIGCTTLPDAYELNYSFDKDYKFKNLRFAVNPGEEVPSITAVYGSAFLYENEIHDLFGVKITNISIDYHGTLYHTALKTPFSIENIKFTGKAAAKAEAVKPAAEGVKPANEEAATKTEAAKPAAEGVKPANEEAATKTEAPQPAAEGAKPGDEPAAAKSEALPTAAEGVKPENGSSASN